MFKANQVPDPIPLSMQRYDDSKTTYPTGSLARSKPCARGIALGHNLDGTILVDYEPVYQQDKQVDLEAKRDECVRIARVLECRICNFERRPVRIYITPEGFIKPREPIPKPLE